MIIVVVLTLLLIFLLNTEGMMVLNYDGYDVNKGKYKEGFRGRGWNRRWGGWRGGWYGRPCARCGLLYGDCTCNRFYY